MRSYEISCITGLSHTQISRITRGECTAHLMAHSVSYNFGLKKPSYEPSEGEELTLTAKCKVKE